MRDTKYYRAWNRFITEGENRGEQEAEQLINKLRSGLFKELSDDELYAFRQRIADAFDMKLR